MITPLFVIALRLFAPLTILRSPFWGMLLAVAADASDVIIFDALGWGVLEGKGFYHEFDKIFDIYYLALAAFVSLRWESKLAKGTALVLFAWRFMGFLAFEITGVRQIMFFAPNIFENFYIIIAGLNKFFPNVRVGAWRLAVILAIAAVPKIIQEYFMHFLQFQTWAFLKQNLFWWLY